MATALTVLRQRLLRELNLGWIITAADLTSVAAGSITSTNMLRDGNVGGGQYKGEKVNIFRPGAATSADYNRPAALLDTATGALAHAGANYADVTSTSEYIELWKYGIRPNRELVDSLMRALGYEFTKTLLALSHISTFDGDMALSTDTNWTDVGTTSTSAKIATAGITPFGPYSYRTVNNAIANSGTRSSPYRIGTSRQFSAYTIASSEVGTSSLQAYDSTNSAAFGTAVTSGERTPQLLAIRGGQAPATCELIALNLTNTSTTGDSYWNQAWLYVHDDLTMRLPSSVNDSFMAPRIVQGRPRVTTGADTYAAMSMDLDQLTEGVDYWLITAHNSAQPYKVRFRDSSYFNNPLFIEASIPDTASFAEDEAATTNVPVHNLLPRWKIDVLDTILLGKLPMDQWRIYREKAEEELITAKMSRPPQPIARSRPRYPGISRG